MFRTLLTTDVTKNAMHIKHITRRIESTTCMLRMTAESRGGAAIIYYKTNVNFVTISVAFCSDYFRIFFPFFLEIKYWALQIHSNVHKLYKCLST